MDSNETIKTTTETCFLERGHSMYRIIVCDDDPIYLEKISSFLKKLLSEKGIAAIIHSFSKREELGDPILKSCDIAFLDIDFDENQYTGIDIARSIRKNREDSIIIFITNYIEYAPEGYEVQAFRYLLKKDLSKKLPQYITEAVDSLKSANQVLKIKIYGEIIDLPIKDIQYMESDKRTVSIHLQRSKSEKVYTCYASISDLEEKLADQGFLRVHKSYLVNMNHIKKLQCNEVSFMNGIVLPVSTRKYPELKRKYLMWKGF